MEDTTTGFLDRVRHTLLSRAAEAFARFPLAILLAAALTIFFILIAEDFRNWDDDFDFVLRIGGTLACGGLWAVSSVLFAEANGKSRAYGVIAGVAGFFAIAALFWFHREFDLVEYGLFTALVLLVGLTPYLFRARDNRAFWEFNHDVWIGAAFALLAAVLLAAGVSAILGTLQYLFKLNIHRELWAETWIVACGFVAPLYWLNTIPKRFDIQIAEGDQSGAELTTGMITVLAKYILVPLLLVYTGILYAYAIKIGVGWELPKGRLGYMVSAFGAAGIVTALLIFPSRDASGPLNTFFWRHWFWLSAIPLALLFLAIYRRISDYGITQDRYLLVIVGIWLLGVVVLFGLRLANRDLRLIPGLLAGLLAVTSVGPWGLEGLPVRQLATELHDLLKAEGSLEANGLLKAKAKLPGKRDSKPGRRMASIVSYLGRHQRLDILQSMLGAEGELLFEDYNKSRSSSRHATASAVMERLLIPTHQTAKHGDTRYFSFNNSRPRRFSLSEKSGLFGPVHISRRRTSNGEMELTDFSKSIQVTYEKDTLHLTRHGKPVGSYDMRPVAERAAVRQKPEDRKMPIIDPKSGSGRGQLLVMSFNGNFDGGDKITLNNMQFWLLFPGNAGE